MKEVLLTRQEVESDYRELTPFEIIAYGDLFQRPPRKHAGDGSQRLIYEVVDENTVVLGKPVLGHMWRPGGGAVLRRHSP
jgi:hypothetical protein